MAASVQRSDSRAEVSRLARERRVSGPWWRNSVLVSGLTLVLLGIGNWITGAQRLAEQTQLLARLGSDPSLPEYREEVLVARSRLDFYHVVESGGHLLVTIGLMLAAAGALRHRRPRPSPPPTPR